MSLTAKLLGVALGLMAVSPALARPYGVVGMHPSRDMVIIDLGSVQRTGAGGATYTLYMFLGQPPPGFPLLQYVENRVETDCHGRMPPVSSLGHALDGRNLPGAVDPPDGKWAAAESGAPGGLADALACGQPPEHAVRQFDGSGSIPKLAQSVVATFAKSGGSLSSDLVKGPEADPP